MILAAFALQITHRFDTGMSVSQVWAHSRRSYLLMGIIMSVFGLIFCVSMLYWLLPTYRLATIMYPLVMASYIALLFIAWVPMKEKPGQHSMMHLHFLGGGFVATGALIGFLVIVSARPMVPPVSYWLAVAAIPYTAAWPLFMSAWLRQYFLVLEIGMVIFFALVITAMTIGI